MKNLKELFGFEFDDIQYFTTAKIDRGSKSYLNNRIKLKDNDKPVGRGFVYSGEMEKTLMFWRYKLKIRNLKEEVLETVESFNTLIDDDFFYGEEKLDFSLGVVSEKVSQIAETTKIDDDNSQNLFSEIVAESEIVEVEKKDGYDSKELKDIIIKNGLQWKLKNGNAFNRFCQSKISKKEHTFKIGKNLYLKRTSLDYFLSFAKAKVEKSKTPNTKNQLLY
jgi:hypothetical protein